MIQTVKMLNSSTSPMIKHITLSSYAWMFLPTSKFHIPWDQEPWAPYVHGNIQWRIKSRCATNLLPLRQLELISGEGLEVLLGLKYWLLWNLYIKINFRDLEDSGCHHQRDCRDQHSQGQASPQPTPWLLGETGREQGIQSLVTVVLNRTRASCSFLSDDSTCGRILLRIVLCWLM